MTADKTKLTIRLQDELDKQLAEYAKENDISKNQAVRRAIKNLVNQGS